MNTFKGTLRWIFDLGSEFVKDHWRVISNGAVIMLVDVVVNEPFASTVTHR